MKKKHFNIKISRHNTKVFLLVALIILIVVIFTFAFLKTKYSKPYSNDNTVEIIDKTMPVVSNKEAILGNKEDLVSFSISPNTQVKGLVSYRGIVRGGYFFEGNILINVLNSSKKVLIKSNAVASADWMTAGPVEFEGYLDFSNAPKGNAYIEIHNDNASGLPKNDKSILIPITIE